MFKRISKFFSQTTTVTQVQSISSNLKCDGDLSFGRITAIQSGGNVRIDGQSVEKLLQAEAEKTFVLRNLNIDTRSAAKLIQEILEEVDGTADLGRIKNLAEKALKSLGK